ncbi:curli-like amyloid fiber formation chaperone CsgH [Sulfitobacter sp. 916]|uniref:curli-like amyloid fiber formation chaperone CsgH n=1 Tax=Sulfitobacter sp. 916 TaxID=3368559 RepID=UPI0037465883
MKQIFLAIATLILSATGGATEDSAGENPQTSRKAWIEVTEAGSLVTIKVISELDAGTGGTYRLEVTKAGPSGRNVNRQSGMLRPAGSDAEQVSSVSRVSVEKGATLKVLLTVEDDAGQVYEDRFSKSY